MTAAARVLAEPAPEAPRLAPLWPPLSHQDLAALAEIEAGRVPAGELDQAFVHTFEEILDDEEARNPGLLAREIDAAATYGSDFARELADIEAGRHPLQRSA